MSIPFLSSQSIVVVLKQTTKIFLVLICLFNTNIASSQGLWINEFHYDNISTDVDEFIEIAIDPLLDPSLVSIIRYNGSDGDNYSSTLTLASLQPSIVSDCLHLYVISLPSNGLQNGAPDGLALIYDGAVVEFLSYEGSFMATEGPANGMTSTDIGVSENNNTTATGSSLQRQGTGLIASDFPTWTGPISATIGQVNTGQTFNDCPIDDTIPTMSQWMLFIFLLILLNVGLIYLGIAKRVSARG